MRSTIFKYISKKFSKNPKSVDRLLISAFLRHNNIVVKKNLFLLEYIIQETDKEEYSNLSSLLEEISREKISLSIETLIEFFEFVISPEDRVVNGAVYTPDIIRSYIVEKTLSIKKGLLLKIADISCGCGGFLYTAARELKNITGLPYGKIFKEQLFGLDIEEYSIARTKLLLSILGVSDGEDVVQFEFNLFRGNALEFNWKSSLEKFKGFDIVIGNPPYVCSRNIGEESKPLLKNWSVCRTGHPDLYIPFFQIGLESLAEDGILGFITMNTFFKSVNGRAVREYFQAKAYYMRIIDFGTNQIFRSRSTYTCICLIRKTTSKILEYVKSEPLQLKALVNNKFSRIDYSSLNWLKGWNLQDNILITKIESTGTPFKEKYTTRNGIATLKNSVYIFKPVAEDRKYYYLENGDTHPIEKSICKDIVNPNMLIEEENLRNLRQKIIFPYTFIGTDVVLIKEQEFRQRFPNAYSYLELMKDQLGERDKGKGFNYPVWYGYGRNQSLEKLRHKLFFPHITPKIPNYTIDSDENLLFYNGMAVIGKSREELLVLRKLMQSRLFWFYIKNSSRPYGSGYFSLSRNYIKNFGIYDFSKEDKQYILRETNSRKLDVYFEKKYGIEIG